MTEKFRNVDGRNRDDMDSVDLQRAYNSFATAAHSTDRYNFAEREQQIREEEKREADLFRILEEYGY